MIDPSLPSFSLPANKKLDGRRQAQPKWWFVCASLFLTGLIGLLDAMTGYELRLNALYLLPIAIATWNAGRNAGLSTATAATLCWVFSFNSTHGYTRPLYFYWDGIVLVTTFAVFVILFARLHHALRSADQRFVRLLDEMNAGVYVSEQATDRLLYANKRLAVLLDAEPTALSAAALAHRFGGDGQHSEHTVKRRAKEVTASGFLTEERFDSTSGRWYLVQSGPIPWRKEQSARMTVVTDITDRRHAQLLRQENQDMLHRTARLSALAESTSMLAHEINQPLTAIATYHDACLRLLTGKTPNHGELVQALEKSRTQAMRAADIVKRMRDAVRSKHPQPALCDLNEIIRESIDLIDTIIENDGVLTDLVLADGLPSLVADKFLLVQVMVNLLENAVDAMQSLDQRHRRLAITTSRQPDGVIAVSIRDHGSGIPATIREKLYTPFLSTKPNGLGLGLSICRSVVEAHGGRLWHSPNADGGTIFHFTLAAERA
ncbi:MAG TPA: ATP-binding protein [Accumulibacter sp.]|mgnify:CR=1 FL=1|nr:ATP-binding protein [Accumulibacter sp.]